MFQNFQPGNAFEMPLILCDEWHVKFQGCGGDQQVNRSDLCMRSSDHSGTFRNRWTNGNRATKKEKFSESIFLFLRHTGETQKLENRQSGNSDGTSLKGKIFTSGEVEDKKIGIQNMRDHKL